ncbi:MAG: TolC family protein, partial [Bacteroidota bacterium]
MIRVQRAALLAIALTFVPAGFAAAAPDPASPGAEATAPAVGVESGSLTLSDALDRALAGHPSVGIARAAADEARGAKGEAMAARFPSLRLSAAGSRFEHPTIVSPIHGFAPNLLPPFNETVLQGSATLGYTVLDLGRGGRIGRARESLRAAEASLDAAGQALASQVVRAYVDVVARRHVLEAHQRRLAALASERARVQQAFEAGRAADVDRLRIDAAAASAQADSVRAAIRLDAAERDLARLIGGVQKDAAAERLVPVALADTVIAPRDSLDALAARRNPTLAAARHREAASRA